MAGSLEASSFEELEAAGLCDCGLPLEGHPPLAIPKPMGRAQADRTNSSLVLRAVKRYNRQAPMPKPKFDAIMKALDENRGHRHRTARQLNISTQTVYTAIRRAKNMGRAVPPARRGPHCGS